MTHSIVKIFGPLSLLVLYCLLQSNDVRCYNALLALPGDFTCLCTVETHCGRAWKV